MNKDEYPKTYPDQLKNSTIKMLICTKLVQLIINLE